MRLLAWFKRLIGLEDVEEMLDFSKDDGEGLTEKEYRSAHDYGMGVLLVALKSRDYGWSDPYPIRKVILVNPTEYRNRITVFGIASLWMGTGHSEWEFLLASWFVEAIVKAIEDGAEEADITHLFNRDLIATNYRTFTKEQVYDHLIKWFEIVDETEDELRLKFIAP